MTATILFSFLSAALVLLAGRKDPARDPFLTGVSLALMAVVPLMAAAMPKLRVLPVHTASVAEAGFTLASLLLGVWFAGFLVMLARLAAHAVALRTWRGKSVFVARIGKAEVRELRGIKGPVAAGVFHPVVLVPDSWGSWSAGNRKLALDHEMAHHRRRDPLWRLLAEISCAVNWFNPLAWWMARRFTIQCEFACDAEVVRHGGAPTDYASLLCDLAEDARPGGWAVSMAGRSTLEVRVRRLMEVRGNPGMTGVTSLVALTMALAALLALLGVKPAVKATVSPNEIRTRWAADPFPGESGF